MDIDKDLKATRLKLKAIAGQINQLARQINQLESQRRKLLQEALMLNGEMRVLQRLKKEKKS